MWLRSAFLNAVAEKQADLSLSQARWAHVSYCGGLTNQIICSSFSEVRVVKK